MTTNHGNTPSSSSSSAFTTPSNINLNEWLPHIPIGHPDSMMSAESVRRATHEFVTRPTDVFVTTFAKTGTTLVTFVAHLLRMAQQKNNDNKEQIQKDDDVDPWLDFDCFYDVVPWPLLSWDIGVDPNTATPAHLPPPRIFKSHLRLASIYRGARYVVTIRQPAAVGQSFYRYLQAKQVPAVMAMPDVDTFICDSYFVKGIPGKRPSVWDYYAEYHAVLDCPAVLILVYEDLAWDGDDDDDDDDDTKRTCIRQLAQFMGLSMDVINDNVIDRILQLSSKTAMAALNHKFDEPYARAVRLNRAADVAQLAPGAKVTSHKGGGNNAFLHPRTLAFLQEQWDKHLGPLGYPHYAALAQAVRQRNQRWFGTGRK